MPPLRFVLMALSMIVTATAALAVYAQAFPARPVRIVTAEVGGGSDFTARQIAQGLSGSLGQQVIVENRPSGFIPGEIVSRAQPDGYTLLLFNTILWTAPLIQKAPYDPVKDFSPVALIGSTPSVLVVNPSLPVKSVADLVALARSKPGELNYGSTGTGAANHLAAEMFKAMAGLDLVRVNYKGGSLALNGLIGGEIHLMFTTPITGAPHVRSGKLKVLAVTSAEPSALAPGVPTMAAAGLPGYESIATYGVFAPAKTPRTIIDRLNEAIVRLLNRPDVKERFFNTGMEIVAGSPERLAATMRSDVGRLGKMIKAAGIRTE
jgi:tripartite-type tricarboxylate transporter receptor subunit TctC